MVRGKAPKIDVEQALVNQHGLVAAMDEVGRGALAGPVTVGVVLFDASTLLKRKPNGLRDSKLLTPLQRASLTSRIHGWVIAGAVADASAEEIDAVGIIGALRRAGERALAALPKAPSIVLLDGSHDWLTRKDVVPELSLFSDDDLGLRHRREDPHPDHDVDVMPGPGVVTKVKADLGCATVAAASVLAKVHRDQFMMELHDAHPHYGWLDNKGYAAAVHRHALTEHGPSQWHRHSWDIHNWDSSTPTDD